ncbi:MAG: hypothetical protein ACI8WB_002749, partial [Phenylobacterium sp.]
MRNFSLKTRNLKTGMLFAIFGSCLAAAVMTPAYAEDEQDENAINLNVLERNRVTADVEHLGIGLMGDTVDPYSGSLSFRVTDVSIPGNSQIPVNLSRSISNHGLNNGVLVDWTLDIPRLEGDYGMTSHYNPQEGPDCRYDFPAPIMRRSKTFSTDEFFNGLNVHDGQGYSGLVITPADLAQTPYPLPDGYTRQTKDNWLLKCSDGAVVSDGAGSDYIAQSPAGLTYSFSTEARKMSKVVHKGAGTFIVTQTVAKMVDRIEDPFGNWAVFGYETIDVSWGTDVT